MSHTGSDGVKTPELSLIRFDLWMFPTSLSVPDSQRVLLSANKGATLVNSRQQLVFECCCLEPFRGSIKHTVYYLMHDWVIHLSI